MAQRIARRTSNPKVAGSNPAGGGLLMFLFFRSRASPMHPYDVFESVGVRKFRSL